MPTIAVSGANASISFVLGSSQRLIAAGSSTFNTTQPFCVSSAVDMITSSGAAALFSATTGVYVYAQGGFPRFDIGAGVDLVVSSTANAFHALNVLFKSTTSNCNVDGTDNIGNAGTNVMASSPALGMGSNYLGTTGFVTLKTYEMGLWNGDNSASFGTLSSNQKTFWGF
jgi:hypothetical protein